MSGKKEHKKRYNLKLQFIREWDKWMENRPPMWMRRKFKKWLKNEPIIAYSCSHDTDLVITSDGREIM